MDGKSLFTRTCRVLRSGALSTVAGILMAGPILAQDTPIDGPWLPITSIDVTTDTVSVDWEDFSNLIGLRLYTKTSLDELEWTLVPLGDGTLLRDYPDVYTFSTLGTMMSRVATDPKKFYRLRGVRGPAGACTCADCGCGLTPPGSGSGTDTNGVHFVFVPGPDGAYGTSDDVYIRPATSVDIDSGTGIVIVPDGSVISTNGAPLVIGGVNDVPGNGTFPPGTLVHPDGTIVVPGTGTPPTINPNGTINVNEGNIIIVPPYDRPYTVPAPGGTYVPGVPPSVILNTVPPTTITLPDDPFPPPTTGPVALDGTLKIIPGATLGDDSDWMAVAQHGNYYLIVRLNVLSWWNWHSFGDGTYGSSNVKQEIETWWDDPNSINPLFKSSVVPSDALNMLGSVCSPSSINDGLSSPTFGTYAYPFALSFSEAARYLGTQWYNGATYQSGGGAYAYSNWECMQANGDIDSSWLRSGDGSWDAGVLDNTGRVNCMGIDESYGENAYRPAVWIKPSVLGL